MQARFPGAMHLLLMRNPVSQFVSARRQLLEQGNPYFIKAPLEVLARNAHHRLVAAALAALEVDVAAGADAAAPTSYRGHLAFWLVCAVCVPERDILTIDADLLVLQPAYRAHLQARLQALTGQTVTLGDARGAPTARTILPWLGIAPLELAACHHAAHEFLARYGTASQRIRAMRMLARHDAGPGRRGGVRGTGAAFARPVRTKCDAGRRAGRGTPPAARRRSGPCRGAAVHLMAADGTATGGGGSADGATSTHAGGASVNTRR